jgi:hypothetical protein
MTPFTESDRLRRTIADAEKLRKSFEGTDAQQKFAKQFEANMAVVRFFTNIRAGDMLARDVLAKMGADRLAVEQALMSILNQSEAAKQFSAFAASQHLIDAALRPLPEMGVVTRYLKGLDVGVRRRFDIALADAAYLATIDVGEDPESEVEPPEEIASKLIEVAPADAMEALRRVGFAPWDLLDRAARDPEIIRTLGHREFEGFVAALVDRIGFEDVKLTPPSGDGGYDVIATHRFAGIPVVYAFECKHYAPQRKVGLAIVRALLGVIGTERVPAAMGVVVTTSTFTTGARKLIVTNPKLDGKDFDDVVGWLRQRSRKRRSTGLVSSGGPPNAVR